MQGNRAVRRDLRLLQRHASRFAEDVSRLGDHLVQAGEKKIEDISDREIPRWRELPKATTESLRTLAVQTKKQLDVLAAQTKRQAIAMDKQVHNRPYPFVTGSFVAGVAAGILGCFAFRRK